MTSNTFLRVADRIGCSLSAACAVHCLAAPLLLTFLSVSPVAEEIEMPMMVITLAIATGTFCAGFVRNTAVAPLAFLLAAAPLMIASRCVHRPWLETVLVVAGAVVLSIGHVVNLRCGHVCAAAPRASSANESDLMV